MQIEIRKVSDIKPYPGNPRQNNAAVDAVAESIRQFGFRQPIVVDAEGVIICGHIAAYGRKRRKWLSQFLDLKSGIPSHDRFNAILGAIKPAEFEVCLLSWITALHEITDGQVVAVDGKTLRRSFDAATSKSAIPMVGAWATANQISLGQVVVEKKSNEITANHGH